ncbi:amidophosphoribosyltransferase [Verrucomicrobiota bacterium]
MGGFFGVTSKKDCVNDLFYGTDYHSHLGTRRGGLAVREQNGFKRFIHDISNAQFRSKFENDIDRLHGNMGIGVISDYEDQPLIIGSHLGTYAIVTVGKITNADEMVRTAFKKRTTHFSEMSDGEINPTELVSTFINQGATFEEGLQLAQEAIKGSCSILLLTENGIYASRDKLGRTPIVVGTKPGTTAVTLETCALPNLGYETKHYLGPGEIVLVTPDGFTQLKKPGKCLKICAFLWVYYGYPASCYEGINVEQSRYRCGACLAKRHKVKVDFVAGIPDSGTGHAIGYATATGLPYYRPFIKYTPTWPRSFMPTDQTVRELVAVMKLIPIQDLIKGKRILFCEDSIVRGTQLKDTIKRLYKNGAKEVHMRPACPPLLFSCKFLNFSRSKSEQDLAARRAIWEMEGAGKHNLRPYCRENSPQYNAMVERIRYRMGLTTLVYQKLDDLISAIGLPRKKICTYCWTGKE